MADPKKSCVVKRILVTGAKGQLGTTLKLQTKRAYNEWVFCGREELDITDPSSIASILEHQPFDFCINCAAYTNVEGAENELEQAQKLNVGGVQNLVSACNEKGVKLLHISTDYVFDGTKETPYVESDLPAPINQYGLSKLQGEQYIQQNSNAFYIIRTSWLYSKTLGGNFYNAILQKAKKGEALTVVDDQIGTPTNVEHLAEFLLKLIEKEPEQGLYHFSDEQPMSWYELAGQILNEHQLQTSITPTQTKAGGAARPRYTPLITEKRF